MAMAIDPTPARVNAVRRVPASRALRVPRSTSDDHRRTMAGFPLNAASERVMPAGPGAKSQAPERVRTSRWHVALKPERKPRTLFSLSIAA